MLRFISGLLLIAAAVSAFEAPGLTLQFGLTGCDVGKQCFKTYPRTKVEATTKGMASPPETQNDSDLDTMCEKDNPRICGLYDKKGSIAGIQFSFLQTIHDEPMGVLEPLSKGFVAQVLFGIPVFSNKIYFVPQETIKNGGRPFDNSTGTGLYLQTFKTLTQIPDQESDMPGITTFKKQNCFPGMGSHWFWNSGKNLTQEEFLPWFMLYNPVHGGVEGFGAIWFGRKKDPHADGSYEDVPAAVIRMIAPDSPDWIYSHLEDYGIFSIHVYFGENPSKISCPKKETAKEILKATKETVVENLKDSSEQTVEETLADSSKENSEDSPKDAEKNKNFFQKIFAKLFRSGDKKD